MITRLLEKVQRVANRIPVLARIELARGRYQVALTQTIPFIDKLGPADQNLFRQRATFALEEKDKDQRSVVIPLSQPLVIEGRTITSLRLKGIFPQVKEGSEVLPYTEGKGFVDRLLSVKDSSTIHGQQERTDGQYSAWGTMSLARLEREVESALTLGPDRTDVLMGFGIYDELKFNGEPVGFAIYGMERQEDTRILKHLIGHIEKTGELPAGAQELAEHSGKLLREMHESGLIHRYPHLGNFGFMPGGRQAKLLDLDTNIQLLSIPKEARAAFLYLDLARTINDYMKEGVYEEIFDGEPETTEIQLTTLLPYFLRGYFKGDTSLGFVKQMEDLIQRKPGKYEINKLFGHLPDFKPGWRRGTDFTLIEPIIRVLSSDNGSQVEIKPMMGNEFFRGFYQAVESVAAALPGEVLC